MKCLLDTHIFIWALNGNRQLRLKHKLLIQDSKNEIFVSYYSLMEISVKMSLGKLPAFNATISDLLIHLDKSDFRLAPFNVSHLIAYESLPVYADHRDPFDRFIIANAIAENLALLTYDEKFWHYKDLVALVA